MAIPEYKTGDTYPPISGVVSDANGPVNISAATGIKFLAKSGANIISQPATIVDDGAPGNEGKWSYTWQSGDLVNPGTYSTEVEVTWSTGVIQTFPSKDTANPTFLVSADIG